jgi:hypothetical protein
MRRSLWRLSAVLALCLVLAQATWGQDVKVSPTTPPSLPTALGGTGCFVGDSITAATTTSDSITFSTTGGTPAYTMSVTGLPSGSVATVNSSQIYITAAGQVTPGSYTITVSSTDSLAATGSQQYTYIVAVGGLISVVALGAPVGPLTSRRSTSPIPPVVQAGGFSFSPTVDSKRGMIRTSEGPETPRRTCWRGWVRFWLRIAVSTR